MKYKQLSKAAKERARQWFKDSEAEMWGHDRAPDLYEDMATCLKFLGITVRQHTEFWKNSRTGKAGSILHYDFQWEGFWSQGDGLVFKGEWNAADVDMTGLAEYAPQDATLKRIAIQMTAIMLKYPSASARIVTINYGLGLPGMHLEEAWTGAEPEDGDPGVPLDGDTGTLLKTQIIAAAHWCYKNLEDNYEYDTSDEAAVEGIEGNEYDFDRDGEVITRSRPKAVTA